MLEAADEDQVMALAERRLAAVHFVHIGQHLDARAGRVAPEQLLFDRTDHQGHVAVANQLQLLRARGRGDAREFRAAGEFRRTLLAQVVQVDGVERELGLRRIQAHEADVARGDVVARQHDEVEFSAALAQQLDRVLGVRRVQRLDAEFLQRRRVALHEGAVVGQEADLAAEIAKHAHQVDHAQRAGILVRRGRGRIDDQHALRAPGAWPRPWSACRARAGV